MDVAQSACLVVSSKFNPQHCGVGVAGTSNPSTGSQGPCGELGIQSQYQLDSQFKGYVRLALKGSPVYTCPTQPKNGPLAEMMQEALVVGDPARSHRAGQRL